MVMVLKYLLGAVFVITLFSNDFKTFVSDRFCKFQIFYCVLLIFLFSHIIIQGESGDKNKKSYRFERIWMIKE